MEIIQERTRAENIALVYEIRDFFDDDSGELAEADFNQKIVDCIENLAFILGGIGLVAMLFVIWLQSQGVNNIVKFAGLGIFCILMMNILFWYSSRQNKLIDATGIYERYGPAELLIYWLYDESFASKILVKSNKKVIELHMDDDVIKLPVKGFSIEGTGKEVQIVDLDNMVLKTA